MNTGKLHIGSKFYAYFYNFQPPVYELHLPKIIKKYENYAFAGSQVRDTNLRTQVKFVHTNWKVLVYLPHTYLSQVPTCIQLTIGTCTLYMHCTLYLNIIMIILLQYNCVTTIAMIVTICYNTVLQL